MKTSNVRRALGLTAGAILTMVGCGIEKPAGGDGAGEMGRIEVALTASTASGTTYRVDNTTFEILNFGGACPTFLCATVPGGDPTVSVELPPSQFPQDYVIQLDDGWNVVRIAADGTETPVAATLLTSAVSFTIKPRRTTPVVFQFRIDGEIVATGNGTVTVKPDFLETLIDDFEDGDGQLAPFAGRNGTWTAFNDGSGVETPSAGSTVLPEVVDTSANYVMHLSGSAFGAAGRPLPDGTFSYGAGVVANFVTDPATGHGVPHNASAYAGIGFRFVMKAPVSAPVILAFFVQTSATVPVDQGGTCAFNCYDAFGVNGFVPADPNGFSFSGVIPFAAMHQVGYGTPATFDPSTLMSINWLVSFADNGQPLSSNVFDLVIDDVAFATGGFAIPAPPPPPGPPAPPPGPPPPPPKPGEGPPIGPLGARATAAPTWTW